MIRAAGHDDLSFIRAIEVACFDAEAWSPAAIEAELLEPTRRMFVAERETGGIIGFASLMAVAEIADLQRIAVLPDYRRQGVGARLLARLIAEAGAARCERLLLEVAADNTAALAMYGTHGFVEISRRHGYYAGGRDAVILSGSLQF
ncbi:MAG TPA: ribosomal protein S18-alanine N-acetyltransferase [Aeromicrobium sp.]|nr:ribosomal protein S18-alanine N-acetyltransferase [Aeromicrobium sp.]